MRIFLTGGTGLIGSHLVPHLLGRGDSVVILSRNPDKARADSRFQGCEIVGGDPSQPGDWQNAIDGCDAVVNLVGENVFGRRWTAEFKRKLRTSRVDATRNVVEAIKSANNRPKTLVQGSAIGYYGSTGEEKVLEDHPPGSGLLPEMARDWEAASHPVVDLGVRLAILRTGVVLTREGGALALMAPLFKWVPGGAAPVGSGGSLAPARGRQWMSWIHLDDLLGILLLILDTPQVAGPLNGTAPNPERNLDFSRALARAVHRPFLPIGPPDVLLRLLLGEVAETIAEGQRVLPAAALKHGYVFKFPKLAEALANLFPRAVFS